MALIVYQIGSKKMENIRSLFFCPYRPLAAYETC